MVGVTRLGVLHTVACEGSETCHSDKTCWGERDWAQEAGGGGHMQEGKRKRTVLHFF